MNCPYCGNKAQWTSNEVIYGKKYGKSFMCYYCAPCDAYVGCHENTKRALGTMANAELREWRKRAHKAIDPLWQEQGMTRKGVYSFLEAVFRKPVHIGEADRDMCERVIEVVSKISPSR